MLTIERDDLRHALDRGRFDTVFQPVFSLCTGAVVGVEALTRFPGSGVGPGPWFAAARAEGVEVELELATARRALQLAAGLEERVCLWLNLGARALVSPLLEETLTAAAVPSLGIEITEHPAPEDDAPLAARCATLRRAGVRIAVDDVGSSALTVRHVARLRPDQLKADLSVTQGLEHSIGARRQARRIMGLARRQRAGVIAEGVETPGQLRRWAELGAQAAQGFLLGGPAPLEEALAATPLAGPVHHAPGAVSTPPRELPGHPPM